MRDVVKVPILWPDNKQWIPRHAPLYTKDMQLVDDVCYISAQEALECYKAEIVLDIVNGRWCLPIINAEDGTIRVLDARVLSDEHRF